MKARLGIVAIVPAICLLFTGALVLATDFVWDAVYAPASWLTPAHWDQDSSYPQNENDNADITDGANTCTYDPGTDLTIKNLTLGGASPTWRKLHIKDGGLDVDGSMTLGDYAELDVDQDMNVHGSTLADTFVKGNVKVDVAANKTLHVAELRVKGADTLLDITTAGTFSADFIIIDAEAEDAPRALKLVGGTLSLGPHTPEITVESDLGGNGKAKLWVASTTLDFDDTTATFFYVIGGDARGEEAELDLDVDVFLTTPGSFLRCTRLVNIDIAANKILSVDRFIVQAAGSGAICRFTAGSGAEIKGNPLE